MTLYPYRRSSDLPTEGAAVWLLAPTEEAAVWLLYDCSPLLRRPLYDCSPPLKRPLYDCCMIARPYWGGRSMIARPHWGRRSMIARPHWGGRYMIVLSHCSNKPNYATDYSNHFRNLFTYINLFVNITHQHVKGQRKALKINLLTLLLHTIWSYTFRLIATIIREKKVKETTSMKTLV
jgi:hypothetical protein